MNLISDSSTLPRVLHIGKYFPPAPGGMEVFLQDLILAQHQNGQAAFALVHGTPHLEDPIWLMRVPTHGKLLHAPIAPGFASALDRAIERYQPDVLHIHMPNTSAFWALASPLARSLTWVIHWHSDVVSSDIRTALRVAYHAYRPFEQRMLARASAIFVTSPNYLAASQALEPWLEKCRIVPLGLDFSRLPAPNTQSVQWRPGALKLLSVGRLTYYKGFETLIHTVASLKNVELRIIGEGELGPKLKQLIDRLTPNGTAPNIFLMGGCSNEIRNAWLATCDLFCLASRERTEAFGIAVMEAAYFGRPCLVSDLPGSGLPWLVEQLQNGYTAPVDDYQAWQKLLLKLSNSQADFEKLGAVGKVRLSEQFSIHKTAEMLAAYMTKKAEPVPNTQARVLVVIPAKNEALTIQNVIQDIRKQGIEDILVVDDQSTDETAQLAESAGALVLRPVLSLGAWGAMQAGMRYALRKKYDYLITMDADGQHEAKHIHNLLEPILKQEADASIGAFPARGSNARRFAWAVFRMITGLGFEDLTSGFRAYNLRAYSNLCEEGASSLDYQDIGVLLRLRRNGIQMVEVPVQMQLRNQGQSRIFSSWLAVAGYLLKTTLICFADRATLSRRPKQ